MRLVLRLLVSSTTAAAFGWACNRPDAPELEPCSNAEECVGEPESSSGTGRGSGESTTGGEKGSETEGSGTTTTGGMPCATDEDCGDAAAPYCSAEGLCVACDLAPSAEAGDAACAMADPMRGVCAEGTCVTCTEGDTTACDEQRLLCDVAVGACVPCVAHEECSTGACELAAGTCFAEGMLVHVDGDGGQDFLTVSDAVAAVPPEGSAVIIVHERDGYLPYAGGVVISTGSKVALLSAAGENPLLRGTGMSPALQVQGEETAVYLDGLTLSGTNGRGVEVVGGLVWVDRSRIVQNAGGGVLANSGAELTLRNSFVGGDLNDVDAVFIESATARILYSTIGAGTLGATAVSCSTPDEVTIHNSILVSRGNEGTAGRDIDCARASVTFSATESVVIGEGNQSVGELPITMPGQWFVNYASSDFRLQNEGLKVFANIAQWQTGDPLTDIHGDPRPNADGSPDYAGADVP